MVIFEECVVFLDGMDGIVKQLAGNKSGILVCKVYKERIEFILNCKQGKKERECFVGNFI